MFDNLGAFTRQFTPIDGGYVYFPSQKAGGKLVTTDEYEGLLTDWEKVSGRGGQLKFALLAVLAVLVGTFVAQVLELPEWARWILIGTFVMFFIARLYRASFAPRRLVRDRPDILPPRSDLQTRKDVRALMNWRLVIFGTIFSGSIFYAGLVSTEQGFVWWAWVLGSGFLFGVYIWAAVRKLMDAWQ